jgi:hypothetical protein
LHIIDLGVYVGAASNDEDIQEILDDGRTAFDLDTYMTRVLISVYLRRIEDHQFIRIFIENRYEKLIIRLVTKNVMKGVVWMFPYFWSFTIFF